MGIAKLVLLTKLQSVNGEKCDVKKLNFWNYGIVLGTVTIHRIDTQTNKLKLTSANSSFLSDFCH